MMEILQKIDNGKVVICNLGNFYVSVGRDAVLLNNLLKLKVSCFKEEICKVGFPIDSLEKYTELLIQKRYGYVVYYFDQKKEELQILESYKGKYLNNLKNENINCYICSKGIGKYKKTDKYIIALSKLLEIEQQDIQDRLSKKKDIGEIENKQKEEVKRKRKIWFQNKNKKPN